MNICKYCGNEIENNEECNCLDFIDEKVTMGHLDRMSYKTHMTVTMALFCVLTLTNCAMPQTAHFGIMYGVDAPLTVKDVTPDLANQIDLAALAAALLVGVNPEVTIKNHGMLVVFHDGPIDYDGSLYSGLTEPGFTRVLFTPKCLFDPQSALLHEMVHEMFAYQRGGDMDNQHVNVRWQLVPAIAQQLAAQYCGGDYVPSFMPEDPNAGSMR